MADTVATFTVKQVYCADTAILPIQCRRSDGTTAIDLTGATLAAALRRQDKSAPDVTWAIGSELTVVSLVGGNAQLLLTKATTNRAAGMYSLDVTCTEADGTISTVSGPIQLVGHATT